jgi:hypothetical protein
MHTRAAVAVFHAETSNKKPRTGCHRPTPSFGAYLNSRLAAFHSRFGRGRGKGTACRSTSAICAGCVTDGVEDVKKATSGSSDGGLRTATALGIEPVSNSLVGTCLPPPLISRIASRVRTRIVATPILSSVWRLGVSQGTAHKCRILRRPKPKALFAFSRQHWIGILECSP